MNRKEHITKILEDEFLTDGWCETSTGFESMGYAIEDVVEKIMDQTCKNCVHAMPSGNDSMIICPMLGLTRRINWNCGDFERKEDDE